MRYPFKVMLSSGKASRAPRVRARLQLKLDILQQMDGAKALAYGVTI